MTAPPATAAPSELSIPAPLTGCPRDETDVRAALAAARELLDGGHADAAVSKAWAAAEAAVRLAADGTDPDREDPLPPDLSPKGTFEFAVTRGIVSRPAYFAAVEALKVRDAPPTGADPADALGAAEAVAEEALLTLRQWPLGALSAAA